MEWLKPFLPLLQSALKMYAGKQFLKKSSENAKEIAVRSGVLALGGFVFLLFFLASILMSFFDLGHQLEAHDGIHFSGMMLSGVFLSSLGLFFFGVCFGVSQYLSTNEQKKRVIKEAEVNPYASLALLGEEFVKQLIQNLNDPKKPTDS